MAVPRIPILVYHHVYVNDAPELQQAGFETGAGVLDEETFRRQLQYITDSGWRVISTSDTVDWLTRDKPLGGKVVVLHFDNGWLDTATVVLPILREYGVQATCFPITDGVEAASGGDLVNVRTLTEGVIKKPFMNWQQINQLVEDGWEIGAHTATHCKIADSHAAEGDNAVIREAETANDLFDRHLGFVPEHFAYPSGSHNDRSDQLLSIYYRSLRLWHFDWPIRWTFTDRNTSPQALDCQNIDMRVSFEDFKRIFDEATM